MSECVCVGHKHEGYGPCRYVACRVDGYIYWFNGVAHDNLKFGDLEFCECGKEE